MAVVSPVAVDVSVVFLFPSTVDDDDCDGSTTCRLQQSQFKDSLCILSAFVSTFDRPPRVCTSHRWVKRRKKEKREKKNVDGIYNYSDHISMEIIIYSLLLTHHFVINDIPYSHQLLRWWWWWWRRRRRQPCRCDIAIVFPIISHHFVHCTQWKMQNILVKYRSLSANIGFIFLKWLFVGWQMLTKQTRTNADAQNTVKKITFRFQWPSIEMNRILNEN